MEGMINTRLVWFLESNGLLSNIQCGFRQVRSTLDHLVRFETFIRNAFAKKEHAVSIFFDIKKTYDTTWKCCILKDLFDMGLKGKLPNFISNFLSDREFNVRVNSTHSDIQEQEMGVPQRSILSVTLFSIKMF
jgi:potassium voltage-gated channel Eag-related subfamily H protein 8